MRARRGDGGLAVLTCSGGDSALAADECERMGLALPRARRPPPAERLRELLPDAATVGNPLDYTALIWGEVETLRDIVVATGSDPAIDQLLVLYDQPGGHRRRARRRAGPRCARASSRARPAARCRWRSPPPCPSCSTTRPRSASPPPGIPPVAGLRTGLACVAALRQPPGDPARLREIGAARRRRRAGASHDGWLAEHEAKQLLRAARLPVVEGRLVADEDDAVAALGELGGPVALKLSAPALRHKSEPARWCSTCADEGELRAAHRRLGRARLEGAARAGRADGARRRRAARGGARWTAWCPHLVIAAGGLWTEAAGRRRGRPAAGRARAGRARRSARCAPRRLFTGGRGRPPLDVAAAARWPRRPASC